MSEQILFSSYNEIPQSNLKNVVTGISLKFTRINEKSKLQKYTKNDDLVYTLKYYAMERDVHKCEKRFKHGQKGYMPT